MTMGKAISTCFSKYATFSGRARRSEYWWFVLFVALVSIVGAMVDAAAFGVGTPEEPATQVVQPVWNLATFLPLLAAGWRRLHDAGRPGWYLLVPVLVSLGLVLAMFVGVIGFAGLERAGADEEVLRTAAGGAGLIGIAVAVVAQLVIAVLLIWWLTRPTEPGPNRFGPEPA